MHLPRRSSRVERPADHLGCKLLQFGDPAGSGQPSPMEMLIEIEVRVVDPSGTMQVRGHLDESSTERRNQVEAVLHEPVHLGERVAVGRRRRIEDAGHADLHGGRRRVEIHERSVHAVESLHGISKRWEREERRSGAPHRGMPQPGGSIGFVRRSRGRGPDGGSRPHPRGAHGERSSRLPREAPRRSRPTASSRRRRVLRRRGVATLGRGTLPARPGRRGRCRVCRSPSEPGVRGAIGGLEHAEVDTSHDAAPFLSVLWSLPSRLLPGNGRSERRACGSPLIGAEPADDRVAVSARETR